MATFPGTSSAAVDFVVAEDEIICNGKTITLPTLQVVKDVPVMSAGTNIDWLLHLHYTRRDFEFCKKLIDKELPKHLNPEYLYYVKALIDREEGNNNNALDYLQKAIELNSKNIETFKEIGKTLFFMGDFDDALGIFREAEELSMRPDHEIYHFIGELLHRSAAARNQLDVAKQEQQEAKSYFQKAVQHGKKLESFQRLAEIYRKEKDYGKAIEVLECCLLQSPENTEVLTEIGILYLKINETQKAFDRLSEVINVDKKCSKGLFAFGAILQSRNDIDGALANYNQIAAEEPDYCELWNNIGLCFFKKKKYIAAISSLRRAIWLSPLNYNALYNLSLVYIQAQQYASAFHTISAAINLSKDNAECYMLLGLCLRRLDDPVHAFTAFERASKISLQEPTESDAASATHTYNTRNPLIHLNFALFCYETGRISMANEQYNRFLSCSQDMILPTDYRYQATKLKSLLKISSDYLMKSATNNDFNETQTTTTATTTTTTATTATTATAQHINDITTSAKWRTVDSQEYQQHKHDDHYTKDDDDDDDFDIITAAGTLAAATATAAANTRRHSLSPVFENQPEIPLEVNVVNAVGGIPNDVD